MSTLQPPPTLTIDTAGNPEAALPHAHPERLWKLFRTVLLLSSVSWGGLALIAQLENHYVDRKRRLTRLAYSDMVALAWMVPGPVGCNVAVQLGHALRGRTGGWLAGIASVLPFFALMSLLATCYQTAWMHAAAPRLLFNHFNVVLAMLIAHTWLKQTRALVRGTLEWSVTLAAGIVLLCWHGAGAYVAVLGTAFAVGWFASPKHPARVDFRLSRTEWQWLAVLAVLLSLFAAPLPPAWQATLLWPRLAGAGMTLFGGGFSALPVLKSVFVIPGAGIDERDFTLAFSLSPLSPGPLLNVVPFLGYLAAQWSGALIGTFALFVPSGWLAVFSHGHLRQLQTHPRFEHSMRVLRAVTTVFLALAVLRLAQRTPPQPAYLLTAVFAGVCFMRLKLPVFVVYGAVAAACGMWLCHANN